MNSYIMDMDINSMYAWSPLVIKQSLICKLLKQRRSGKSHHAKIQAKRRLRLYKNAWIEYDVETNKEWTKKHIGTMEIAGVVINAEISFDFDAFEKENKECLNKTYGSLT